MEGKQKGIYETDNYTVYIPKAHSFLVYADLWYCVFVQNMFDPPRQASLKLPML